MTYKEFLMYLEENFDGYKIFMQKAIDFQQEKNKNRPAKKRWDQAKVEKASYEMWKQGMQTLYNNLKTQIKSAISYKWTEYIVQHEVLENLQDTISDLNFIE